MELIKSSSNASNRRRISVRSKTKKALLVNANRSESDQRLRGVQVIKPILYGSVALPLVDTIRLDGHTHQWTVYLKPFYDEDLSVYVRRVQFKLHYSYENTKRVVFAPPYCFTETGWGEFRIQIKVYFNDNIEKPAVLFHDLKLFERDVDKNIVPTKEPVYSEFYDEVIFMEPSVALHELLMNPKSVPSVMPQLRSQYEEKKVQHLQKILEAKLKIKSEIEEVKMNLEKAKSEISGLKCPAQKSLP